MDRYFCGPVTYRNTKQARSTEGGAFEGFIGNGSFIDEGTAFIAGS